MIASLLFFALYMVERRLAEFKSYASQMTVVVVKAPQVRGDCLVTVIHLLADAPGSSGPFKPAHFPMGSFWQNWIDGWTDGDKFEIAPTKVSVGEVNLVLLTAAPLGRLNGECFIAGATRST